MDNAKVDEVLRKVITYYDGVGFLPERFPAEALFPTENQRRKHAYWMAAEAMGFSPDKLEKKMRWLGFIQGIMWSLGDMAIEQLKKDNMPEGEEFRG